jgi:hypothetical protein
MSVGIAKKEKDKRNFFFFLVVLGSMHFSGGTWVICQGEGASGGNFSQRGAVCRYQQMGKEKTQILIFNFRLFL